MWFPNKSDTNMAVQAQKMARDRKSREIVLSVGADQLRSYCELNCAFVFASADCWCLIINVKIF